MFRPEMQVTQYVAQVAGLFGFRFNVFRTGSGRHYLMVCAQNPDIRFPVLKADLEPQVRSALAHGWGHF
jgi:hypothetical protein